MSIDARTMAVARICCRFAVVDSNRALAAGKSSAFAVAPAVAGDGCEADGFPAIGAVPIVGAYFESRICVCTLAGARATAHNPACSFDSVAVPHDNIGTLARVRSGTNHYTFFCTFTVRENVGTSARVALALVVARVALPAPVFGILAVALAVCASLV